MPPRGVRVERPGAGTAKAGWTAIIDSVQTPLGFFALVVLILESVLGALVPIVSPGLERLLMISGMLVLILALIVVVTFLAYKRPGSLNVRTETAPQQASAPFSLLIGPPAELPTLDITRIEWNEQECFILTDKISETVKLVPSRVGPTYRVELPEELLGRIRSDCVRLRLKDGFGNRWQVRPFYLFENLIPLSLVERKEKIIDDYSSE